MGKKDGEELTKEEKAAKKAKKEAKRALEAAEEEKAAKKAKADEDDTPAKLSKEEKAAKKAAKEAKKAAKEGKAEPTTEEEKPSKKDKKDKKDKKSDAGDDEWTAKKAKKEEVAEAPAPAPESDGEVRVYVSNLPFKMTDEWMQEEFAACGKITKFEWLSHSDTGRFKGSGFLTFATKAEADAACALNGKELEGRPMKVELASPRKSVVPGGIAGSGDVGEPSASIFVGNLSWSVTEEMLRATFKDCGTINNVNMVQKDGEFRGFCFIDFDSIESATKAVAYADADCAGRPMRINFSKSSGKSSPDKKPFGDKGGAAWKAKPGGEGGRTERPYKPQNPKPDGCLELFCGNLPWTIDETKITEFFGKAGAKVASTRWLNDKETGEFKGIGFVAFESTADVDKAVTLGGENLEGRPIRLDYAGQKSDKPKGAWQGGDKSW